MLNLQVDLTNCDREPIHIPGQVQSHGFLIVLDHESIIRYYSNNIATFIKSVTVNLYGKPLTYIESILGDKNEPDFITKLIIFGKANKGFDQTNPVQIDIGGVAYYLIISTAAEYFLLEFEPVISDIAVDVQKVIGRSITQMLADKKLRHLLNNSALQVKNITNYDRVMIYRFAEDGHGEVVAEAKNDDLPAWLGLHYPASDIPKQARELYKLNLTRLIADVHATPAKILTDATNMQPLDLTNSQLRAVSPIHIQYLKNMGVASSFSISLLYNNELWGLIACHNYTPRFIDYKSRESSKLIGQILSSALEFRQDEENLQVHEIFKTNIDKLAKYLLKSSSIEDALTREPVTLLDVVNANGAILIYEKNIARLGVTPDDEQINGLLNWIHRNNEEPLFYTTNLTALYPQAVAYKNIASGIMLLVLSKELQEYVVWFKPEVLQTVEWAGNPEKPVEVDPDGFKHLSPRHSFDTWSQVVVGTSDNWSVQEIKSAVRLKEEITYAISLKASAIRLLNEKLRQAYEELDTFSYTISHDLKHPITAIKSYAQLLTTDATIAADKQKLLHRIAERADKMNYMINAVLDYSRIGRLEIGYKKIRAGLMISEIIKDLDVDIDKQHTKITVGETPDLFGDPVMMSQVFSNLLSNAVKYSRGANPAIIHIEGTINEKDICYRISDNGIGIEAEDISSIFILFNRMDNAKKFEGTGVGLAIVKRIVEKHNGRIWAQSNPGKGTVFFVSFNKEIAFVPVTASALPGVVQL